jgi:HAD superfamily hydrolase (TIGR01490 family)
LYAWREQFMDEKIRPIILDKARSLVQQHRDKGDILMIITATNRFVTQPIADELGIENLLATEPEFIDGHYTGEVSDIPCFKDGKVKRLQRWLEDNHASLQNSWFYSDSHNDIPLLKEVSFPVATDPDDTLRSHAVQNRWRIISLR